MKYSLIIPHYNDIERIQRLLRTIPIERPDIEVIVVDDCSPDQEALNAMRATWPQICWLSTPENAGAGVARNVGLDAAQGRWLVFGDSDDEFLPGAFDTFDRVLQPDDELVYFLAEGVQEVDSSPSVRSVEKNELVTEYFTSNSEESLRRLKREHTVPWAKVYSQSFIKKYKLFFDSTKHYNDFAFSVLAAFQSHRVRAELTAVYRIYRRAGSLTSDLTAAAFLERFHVVRSVAVRVAALGIQEKRASNGYILMSLRYGPWVALQVWWLAIRSPMKIEWTRAFELKRWRRFILNRNLSRQENL